MSDYFGQITTETTSQITTPSYTVPRTSALALDMLKLSMRKNSSALQKAGFSDPLARPAAGTRLFYPVYDLIEDYAESLLSQRAPFFYQTVTGETRSVQSNIIANAAKDYIPQTIKLWGYVRATGVTPEPTPVYTPPAAITPEPTPVLIEESRVILWSVSYTLAEAGYTAYPQQAGRGRIGVSQQSLDSLVHRASYIADLMVQQNTYSPRL